MFVEIMVVHLSHMMLIKLVILRKFLIPRDLCILDFVEDLDELLAFFNVLFLLLDFILLLSC